MYKNTYGFAYARVEKLMYRLVQAVIITPTDLKYHLLTFVCAPAPVTLDIWRHKTNGINLNMVVDDFSTKYIRKEDK